MSAPDLLRYCCDTGLMVTSCVFWQTLYRDGGMPVLGRHLQLCDYGKTYKPYRPRHSMDKKFPCDQPGCNKSFYEKGTLKRHKAKKHSPDVSGSPDP